MFHFLISIFLIASAQAAVRVPSTDGLTPNVREVIELYIKSPLEKRLQFPIFTQLRYLNKKEIKMLSNWLADWTVSLANELEEIKDSSRHSLILSSTAEHSTKAYRNLDFNEVEEDFNAIFEFLNSARHPDQWKTKMGIKVRNFTRTTASLMVLAGFGAWAIPVLQNPLFAGIEKIRNPGKSSRLTGVARVFGLF